MAKLQSEVSCTFLPQLAVFESEEEKKHFSTLFIVIVIATGPQGGAYRAGKGVGPLIEHVAKEHEHAAEKGQAQKGDANGDAKGDPVGRGSPPNVHVLDLDGEEGRDEADGQEEDAELGQQGGAARQARRCRRVLLLRQVEIL